MGRDPSTLFPPRRLSICGSVHPSVRPSLFCTTRSFKRFPKPRRERERDQLATRTRAAAAVLGRRQRRPWPGEGPERMRLRANWKLVFPLSLPSSPLRSSSFGVCPDTEAALASFLLPMGLSSAAPPARARPVCPCVCACEFAPNQEQLPLNPRCRIDLFFSSRINYFP